MMDTITSAIVTALAAGIGETGKEMIKDAYTALKSALKKRFGQESDIVGTVKLLESKPKSKHLQAALQEEIATAQANENEELKRLAEALLKKLQETLEGQKIIKKYNINAENIGVVGDNARISGGQHFSHE